MARKLILAAVLTAALTSGAPILAQAQPATTAAPAAEWDSVLAGLDQSFAQWAEQAHAPGVVWGVVHQGRLVHVGVYGVRDFDARRPVDADSLFRIASMSKAFTALAVLKLRDEGRLSLDAPAEDYVPELRGLAYPTADSPKIRVRDLLNHTAGFVEDNPWGDRQQVMSEAELTALLRQGVPFAHVPGTRYEYSNLGYALLGRIITNVSGRPYKDYIEAEIMHSLGMASSGYDIFESDNARRAIGYRWENDAHQREPDLIHGTFGAMGGVQTSANDYARWIAFLLSAWPPRDGPETGPVRRSTVREMAQGLNFASPRSRQRPDGTPCPGSSAYGMGLFAIQDCELGAYLAHSGGYPGYGSYMLVVPDRDLGLFAFSSRTYNAPVQPLTEAALTLVRSGLAPVRDEPPTEMLAAAYADAQAVWRAGDILAVEDRLAMNVLLDRSAENWRTMLSGLRDQAGACDLGSAVRPAGRMTGLFTWSCERGVINGRVNLAPTTPVTLQAITLRFTPNTPGS
ncbi:serine hydrolase domain-containing protein [Brevundimonas sp. 2R-24]|uniref:Serine hydrolase domain-containing protein n=1 Tax=Peiella sedimenti TaxID=3061083 RepID=A0ABT8SLY0_9CAUL|nr:serine hydrolase domain-containing protein [Caulobacteraceae bacterium XZ-24]